MQINLEESSSKHPVRPKESSLAVSYDSFIIHSKEREQFRRKADADFEIARKEYLDKKRLLSELKPILFVDFDGTLCVDRYWRSLTLKDYKKIQKLLFEDNKTLVDQWMRGKYSAEEINQYVANSLGIPYEKLWQIFLDDCRTMTVSKDVLDKLLALRSKYIVILLTGNMDSFSRFTVPALGQDRYFDRISNSFNEGKNKTDNDGEIFIEYSRIYKVLIKECVLIDDNKNVCTLFEKLGGSSYLITFNHTKDGY